MIMAICCALAQCALADGVNASASQNSPGQLSVSCSPERPIASPGDSVQLWAWAGPARQLQYKWSVSAGEVISQGANTRWTLTDVKADTTYEASVTISDGVHGPAECALQVYVESRSRDIPPVIETGRAFLINGNDEAPGYGLYSYLLLGSLTDSNRDRILSTIDAYLRNIEEISRLDQYFQHLKLNITYLPVTNNPGAAPASQWILDHYDYARARAILDVLPGTHRDGPYIVSFFKPATRPRGPVGPYLIQDLSTIPTKPPELIAWWIREFLDQAAQEDFRNSTSLESLALKLRTTIAIVAAGLPDAKSLVSQWIAWKQGSR